MRISLPFLRVFFGVLGAFFILTFTVSLSEILLWQKIALSFGAIGGFILLLFGLEKFFKNYNLKAFNTVALGLFFGYLMGHAFSIIFNSILELSNLRTSLQPALVNFLGILLFLVGTYVGTYLTVHLSHEIHFSIPFFKFSQLHLKKKDFLIDSSALLDSRILDLAATGLLDNDLVIPRFLLKELHTPCDSSDEACKMKAKRILETLKKLESLPHLNLRYNETDLSSSNDPFAQLLRLARSTDCNIITADISQVQAPSEDGIKVINLNSLSNALKPLMQAGESMKIKIQRFGKEPNQGVGYLEDGTMVVVNGGGDFIGECIDVIVLSVKHTSSGRMIFCNTMEEIPTRNA